jgi:hypothetical protein
LVKRESGGSMDFFLKILGYSIFVLGSLYFFFGGSNFAEKPRGKHFRIIMIISVLILSYYYWFPH